MITKKPKRYPLAEGLVFELKTACEKGQYSDQILNIYSHLVSMMNEKDLDNFLHYYKKLAAGKDSYFKAVGKRDWFAIFHKSFRTIDVFSNIKQTVDSQMSESEQSEYFYLHDLVSKVGFDKTSKKEGQMFNDTYKRYLELWDKKRMLKKEKSVGGHIDSIFWHTISLDKEGKLIEILKKVFKYK